MQPNADPTKLPPALYQFNLMSRLSNADLGQLHVGDQVAPTTVGTAE
jgi:hypothetical protein